MADNIRLDVLVEDQAEAAAKLLAAAGPDRAHEVHAQTGGFLVPGDIAAEAGLLPSAPVADKPVKAAAKA